MEDDGIQPHKVSNKPRIIILSSVLVVLCLIGLHLLPKFIDTTDYKQHFIDELTAVTGKKVTLTGNIQLKINPLFNNASFVFNDITLTDITEESTLDFLQVKTIELNISLYNFFLNNKNIESIVLDEADINFLFLPDGKKNWAFSENLHQNLSHLDSITFNNSELTYGAHHYSKINITIDTHKNGKAKIKGNAFDKDHELTLLAELGNYKENKNRDLTFQAKKEKNSINFQGEMLGVDDLKINGVAKVQTASPTLVRKELSIALPFLSSMLHKSFKDPLDITFDAALSNGNFIATNLKITSTHTKGSGQLGFSLYNETNLYAKIHFDKFDVTNLLNFDDNIEDISDQNEDYLTSAMTAKSKTYIDFSFIKKSNITLKISADEMKLTNVSLKNFYANFVEQDAVVKQGEVTFSIKDNTLHNDVKLTNINFGKVNNTHFIIGDFINIGNNIDKTLKLFNLQDYLTINDHNLNYSITSKIIFTPKEISLFDIEGKIGDHGVFTGSIASRQKKLADYNIHLEFDKLKLSNFDMPLFKKRTYTLLTKSQDKDYLSYFRWFRTLSSTYNVKLIFNNTEFNDEVIDSLTSSCVLEPGNMLLTGKIKSEFASSDYSLSLIAQAIKPKVSIKINGDHLNYNRLNNLVLGFLNENDNKFTTQEPIQNHNNSIWSDKNFNLFKIQKYSADFDIYLKNLQIDTHKFNHFKFIGHTSNDIFYVDNIYAGLYDGRLQARGNISFFDKILYQFSFTASHLESQKLLQNIFPDFDSITGQVAATGSIISQGSNLQDFVSNLGVSSSFASSKLNINGINADEIVDIALKRKSIDNDKVLSQLHNALNFGDTDVTRVTGNINANKGIFETKNTSFKSRFTNSSLAMSLDLNNMTISSNTEFLFKPSATQNTIRYNILQTGDVRKKLQRKIEDRQLLSYISKQYNIFAAPSTKVVKPITKKSSSKKPEAPSSDEESYIYHRLERNKQRT